MSLSCDTVRKFRVEVFRGSMETLKAFLQTLPRQTARDLLDLYGRELKVQSKQFGFELLTQQLVDHIRGEAEAFIEDRKIGDSEIEKLFFMALSFRVTAGSCEYRDLLLSKDREHTKSLFNGCPEPFTTLIVQPQAQIEEFRVDFLISALALDTSVERRLVVECDGHAFHERTKEQAARDRSRDRWLTTHDYDVFRFTGSELWRDPWGCATQIVEWGVKGW